MSNKNPKCSALTVNPVESLIADLEKEVVRTQHELQDIEHEQREFDKAQLARQQLDQLRDAENTRQTDISIQRVNALCDGAIGVLQREAQQREQRTLLGRIRTMWRFLTGTHHHE